MKDYSGEAFLNKLYRDLHMSDVVMHTANSSDKPREKVSKYMKRLERIHGTNNENIKNHVRNLYHEKYIIKEENLPSGLSEEQKSKIINAQKDTLDMWLNYLTDENVRYPMWAKYWAFQGMLKIGTYDEETNTYKRRNEKTPDQFIEANPEVISKCIDLIVKQVNKKLNEINVGEEGLKKLVESGSFQKLYTVLLKEQKKLQHKRSGFDGKWIKYNCGSMEDAIKLSNSLQGYKTNWSIAGSLDEVINQVCGGNVYSGGDFYVYYTLDENNEYRIPRTAIYMDRTTKIDNIIGIVGNGNALEDGIETIVENKINTLDFLPDENKKKWLKFIDDCKRLTYLNRKTDIQENLTFEECSFINRLGKSWGYYKDPRIAKIKKNNFINDYELMMKLVIEDGKNLDCASPELRNNFEIVLAAVTQNGAALQYASEELQNNFEIVKTAVKKGWHALSYASEKLKNNIEIVKIAVMQEGEALEYASEELQNNFEIVLVAVTQNGYALQYASEELQNNYEIVLAAVKQNAYALDFASEDLEDSYEIVKVAIMQKGDAIEFASSRWRNNDALINIASKDATNYRYDIEQWIKSASEEFNRKIINFSDYINIVSSNGWALQFVPDELKDNMQLVEACVKVYGNALQYASPRLQKDPYLQKLAQESIEKMQQDQEMIVQGKAK